MDLSLSLLPLLNLFKWTGLWFPKEKDKRKYFVYRLYSYFVVAFFLMAHNICQAISITTIYDNIPAVAETLSVLIVELSAIIKIYGLLKNMDLSQKLVYKTLNQESFQPTHPRHFKMFESTFTFWRKAFYIFTSFSRATVFLWGLFPFINKSFKQKRLPFLAWYPFNYKTSPGFEITFIHQMVSTMYVAHVNVAFDSYVSGLLSHIGVQCDILCSRLEYMVEDCRSNLQSKTGTGRCSEDEVIENMQNVLRKCIYHHKDIVAFSKQVEHLINMGVFAQLVASVIIMCMTMLQMTLVEPMSTVFLALVIYEGSISFQLLMYYWFGNEVICKSSNIPTAIYKCDWVDKSPSFKKDLQFFMHRTQTPICISTINFFVLSMATFISIIRSAYSYYAVLRRVNEK